MEASDEDDGEREPEVVSVGPCDAEVVPDDAVGVAALGPLLAVLEELVLWGRRFFFGLVCHLCGVSLLGARWVGDGARNGVGES